MRFQARRGNGRFIRNTAENTLGMHFNVHDRKSDGSWCGSFNPSRVGESKPTTCHACGESLAGSPLQQSGQEPLHHMKRGNSTACGAEKTRGNSYYEWAYVNCPACLATKPQESGQEQEKP